MIPKLEPVRHESNVTAIAHTFTVKMTPTLAKLLSSQAYTDKSLAAIREPLSNAYDAHVRAGTLDTPADLHLPTELEPYFALRDYGTGLNHDDVIRLFFSYGVSDKHGTNKELGGLGIGAKAFFAYTDTCVITCWHEGSQRVYAATKDKSGLPQGQLVSVGPTDEANGIEIRYPVGPRDYNLFKQKTEAVLQFLPLQVRTNVELTIAPPTSICCTEVDGIKCELLEEGTRTVVMGGIAYDLPHHIYLDNWRRWPTGGWRIHLPIGAVEISASRESLSPTDEDTLYLTELVGKFQARINEQDWSPIIAAQPDWLSASKLVSILRQHLVTSTTLRDEAWRGVSLGGPLLDPVTAKPAVFYISSTSVRRGRKYDISPLRPRSYQPDFLRAYWMPKLVNWMPYYKTGERPVDGRNADLFLICDSRKSAENWLAFLGLDIELLEGQAIHTKRSRANASALPKLNAPGTTAWLNRQVIDIGPGGQVLDQNLLILTPSNKQREYLEIMEEWDGTGLFTQLPQIFRPYKTSHQNAMKRYPHLPTSPEAWINRHCDLVGREKLRAKGLNIAIMRAWRDEWITKSSARELPYSLQFPVPISSVSWRMPRGLERHLAVGADEIAEALEAIEIWHREVLEPLPSVVKTALRGGYIEPSDVLDLYQHLTTNLGDRK